MSYVGTETTQFCDNFLNFLWSSLGVDKLFLVKGRISVNCASVRPQSLFLIFQCAVSPVLLKLGKEFQADFLCATLGIHTYPSLAVWSLALGSFAGAGEFLFTQIFIMTKNGRN